MGFLVRYALDERKTQKGQWQMPKIVNRGEMRTAIMDAAMNVFVTRGYHGASISNVAEVAGLGKGTIYLYFDSKDALTTALVERHFADISNRIIGTEPCKTLSAFLGELRGVLNIPAEQVSHHRVFFEVFAPSFASDAFSKTIARFFDRLGAHYAGRITHLQTEGEIAAHHDATALGRVFASMLDGVILHQGLFNISARRQRRMIKEAITLVGEGLRMREAMPSESHLGAAQGTQGGQGNDDAPESLLAADKPSANAEPGRKHAHKPAKHPVGRSESPEQFDFLQQWSQET